MTPEKKAKLEAAAKELVDVLLEAWDREGLSEEERERRMKAVEKILDEKKRLN